MTETDLPRWPRLLALGLLSAALHLGLLAWMARPAPQLRVPDGSRLALAVRLAPAAPAPPPAAAAPAARPARPAARPRRASMPAAAAPAAPAAPAAEAPTLGEASLPMPGRYAMRMPPPVELTFDVSAGEGQPLRAAPSRLVWETGNNHYRLRFENVPAADGGAATTYTSEGGVNDGGIAPDSALEEREDGASARTRFDRETGQIEFASGRSSTLGSSAQDTVSLLVQLAGMGLADPNQFQEMLSFEVGAAGGPEVVRFDVIGLEQIEGAGAAREAWHLSQRPAPGRARLEVWLAPALGWYPVQLRTSAPNGLVTLQRLRSIRAAPAPPAP